MTRARLKTLPETAKAVTPRITELADVRSLSTRDAYSVKCAEVKALLMQLEAQVTKQQALAASHPVDWAHVGSMAYLAERLLQLS